MFNRESIMFKYFKAFILIIVLPILGINIIFNNVYKRTLLKNASDRTMQTMGQVSLSFNDEVKRISLAAATVSNDDEIMDLVNQWGQASDANAKFSIAREIDSKLNYLFNYTNEVESIIFFFKGKGIYNYKALPVISENDIRKLQWYQNSLSKLGVVSVYGSPQTSISNSKENHMLSALIQPGITQKRNRVEVVYFAFGNNILDDFYYTQSSKQTGDMIVIDENNKIIMSKKYELTGKSIEELGLKNKSLLEGHKSFIDTVNSKKYFITTRTIKGTRWKILNLEDYNILTKDINKISAYFISLVLILVGLFIFFSVFFFGDIIIPINKLVKRMRQVEKGDFDTNINIKGNYEISIMGDTFNNMIYEIKNLIAERDLKERERSKAEIEALQSQINPHFISNTLNSIRFMAMISKVDSIKNMTEALIKLLNAAFGKNGNLITIEKEMDNLNSYVYIMKVRYGDKFDVIFDIEDNIKDRFIIRLILQPILENAILHGISEIEEKGIINIKGYIQEGEVIFEIQDNGVGMTEFQIKKLLSGDCRNTNGFTGIGIMNVDRRIKLNNGEKYGIKVESVLAEFTKVKICLPIIMDDKGSV